MVLAMAMHPSSITQPDILALFATDEIARAAAWNFLMQMGGLEMV